jgi:very-short-patch-repair endonuclease
MRVLTPFMGEVSRSDGGGISISRRKDKKERAYARHNRKNMPVAEVILWERIRRKQLGVSFRRQHPIKPFIADFACVEKRLIIELDGESHIGNENETYDAKRTRYLESMGWTILRFWNDEIYEQLDDVIEQITNNILGGK